YYWTLTPTIILRILDRNPRIERLTYLDADLFFYASPAPLYAEMKPYSVWIHEHRFSPSLKHLEKFGNYNVGLLSFKNDPSGIAVLREWRKRCLQWCYMRFENGKFGDQLYLNDWPERFKAVGIIQHIGAGVAPWNHEQYRWVENSEGAVLVDGHPLIFYHFHGLTFVHPGVIVPAVHYHPLTEEIIRLCFLPYLHSLSRSVAAVRAVLPDFSFGLTAENALTTAHSFFTQHHLSTCISSANIPQVPVPLDKQWDCFCSPQIKDVSRLLGKNAPSLKGPTAEQIRLINIFDGSKQPQVRINQDPERVNQHGEWLFERGDISEALKAFEKAARMDPNLAAAHNNMGVLYWHAGKPQKALAHFKRAVEVDPYDRNTVLNCGEALQGFQRYESAKNVYAAYLKKYPKDNEIKAALSDLLARTPSL
ncbi:MAG: tetratricopeptide repeat protein, partial [Deltaproteobacteria bacterium]|nr:tetratricopeptide repeat protein [Deltaproteobacteria bacterium]